jgi:hypothetical protein
MNIIIFFGVQKKKKNQRKKENKEEKSQAHDWAFSFFFGYSQRKIVQVVCHKAENIHTLQCLNPRHLACPAS